MSVATLAMRLRLHVKQIQALERGDLAALPSLIYVRGFLRSCARELGIDPGPLFADLDRRAGVPGRAAPILTAGSFGRSRFGDGSRSIIVIALVVLVVAGMVGIWIPRHANTVAVDAPAPAIPAPVTSPDSASADAAAKSAETASAVEALKAASAAAAAATGTAARPPVKALGASPHSAPAPAPAPAPEAAPIEEPVAAAPPPPPPLPQGLVLHVRASSWVEVVQANGTTVFSQLCLPGSEHSIQATGPLRVVIGNASMVDAQYRGANIDLVQHANANGVARFTLP
jgi:cytoskeleton protein RodZ